MRDEIERLPDTSPFGGVVFTHEPGFVVLKEVRGVTSAPGVYGGACGRRGSPMGRDDNVGVRQSRRDFGAVLVDLRVRCETPTEHLVTPVLQRDDARVDSRSLKLRDELEHG